MRVSLEDAVNLPRLFVLAKARFLQRRHGMQGKQCALTGAGYWCKRWVDNTRVRGVTPWDSNQLQGATGRHVCLHLLPTPRPYPRSTGVFVWPGDFPHNPTPYLPLPLFFSLVVGVIVLPVFHPHITISFSLPTFVPLFHYKC